MQLTVDAEPRDNEYKMSTIKEVSLNELITNNVVEMFSNETKKSDDIVKDDELASGNVDLQNVQLNNKVKQDNVTTTTESKIENNTSKESVVDDCDRNSCNQINNTEEVNKTVDIVCNDVTKNQHQELESQNKINIDLEKKKNVNKIENNDINEQRSSPNTSEREMKEQLHDDDKNTKNLEDTIHHSKTDNKEIIVKNIEKNDVKETNKDMESLDTESSVSHNVTDKVFNKTEEKKEQSLEDVNQSENENTVSQISLKINNNQNESGKVDQEADLIIGGTPKDQISLKEKEITEESARTTESVIKNSSIEISDKQADEIKNYNGEENSNDIESKTDVEEIKSPLISKSSNVLDILSDDEDKLLKDTANTKKFNIEKQCISLVDDDDVMLIDEETSVKEDTNSISMNINNVVSEKIDESAAENQGKIDQDKVTDVDANSTESEEVADSLKINELDDESDIKENVTSKPLLPINFLNSCKKNLADMTREDLEDFCCLKIVESIMDRSNLGDLKSQLKTMGAAIEEFKKKTTLLTKQNKDLQLVLKSIQDVQKKSAHTPITPLKITRSVGMQVLMTDKPNAKRRNAQIVNSSAVPANQPLPIDKSNRNTAPKVQKTKNQSIPVPRLVPAPSSVNKTSTAASNTTDPGKSSQMPPVNGVRISSDTQKPEKRSRLQSVTVDLTDDEPPMKVTARSSPAPGVRLVPAQNLLPPQRPQFATTMSSPRKVYIPISGPQSQNVRPQTVVLKSVPSSPVPRPRMPANNVNKIQTNTIRMNRALPASRHPAPLPDAVKQYQPTSWKALPPAPDLKLSKVDNGIVISWKIDGYQDDSYEEIISYQLFAYQETNSPPSTALWKKIGDVKALPLPMACTLTQFLAGYKYYFAVRAVDIKSRFGPFSLPASILLLNKM